MDISAAIKQTPRKDFLPDDVKGLADLDQALPIGHGQSNSQPTTVRRMLEWLELEEGMKVLDVGSGSGWTAALLAAVVGKKGHVHAVELIPELVDFGMQNCEDHGIKNVSFHQAGEVFGLPKEAPFDRILVSAATDVIPEELLAQLKEGGKLVIPVVHDILEIIKNKNDDLDIFTHSGYAFVPLVPGSSNY